MRPPTLLVFRARSADDGRRGHDGAQVERKDRSAPEKRHKTHTCPDPAAQETGRGASPCIFWAWRHDRDEVATLLRRCMAIQQKVRACGGGGTLISAGMGNRPAPTSSGLFTTPASSCWLVPSTGNFAVKLVHIVPTSLAPRIRSANSSAMLNGLPWPKGRTQSCARLVPNQRFDASHAPCLHGRNNVSAMCPTFSSPTKHSRFSLFTSTEHQVMPFRPTFCPTRPAVHSLGS